MAKRPAPQPEDDRAENLPAGEGAHQAAEAAAQAEAAQAATALNTEAPQGSPEGGAPAEAEGAIMAGGTDGAPVRAEEGRDLASATDTGGNPEAVPAAGATVAGGQDDGAARAELLRAVAAIGRDVGAVIPAGQSLEILPDRRVAGVASAIELNGWHFGPGAPIPLTREEFDGLKDTGALVEADWDELPEI